MGLACGGDVGLAGEMFFAYPCLVFPALALDASCFFCGCFGDNPEANGFVGETGFPPLAFDAACLSCGCVGNKPDANGFVGDTATDPEINRDLVGDAAFATAPSAAFAALAASAADMNGLVALVANWA